MVGMTSLARRSGAAFLVAGGLLLGSTTLKGIGWFTTASPPAGLVMLFAVPGLLVTFAGLLGLYPRLADRSPRLSRAGLAATIIGGTGLLVTVAWGVVGGALRAVFGEALPATPPEALFVALVATIALAAGLFGVAGLRTRVPSRRVGLLLLGYAATYVALVVAGIALATVPDWLYLGIYGAQPVVLVTTGYHLRRASVPTDRELPASGPVAG
jgi:hypothetical protein